MKRVKYLALALTMIACASVGAACLIIATGNLSRGEPHLGVAVTSILFWVAALLCMRQAEVLEENNGL